MHFLYNLVSFPKPSSQKVCTFDEISLEKLNRIKRNMAPKKLSEQSDGYCGNPIQILRENLLSLKHLLAVGAF